MSVYLGKDKVSLILPMEVHDTRIGIPIDVTVHLDPDTGRWIRPEEYPDLDALEISEDFEGMYLTYDLRKTLGYGWIGLRGNTSNSSTNFLVERGHLNGSEFIVDESFEWTRDTLFAHELDETNGLVQLWRVRGDNNANGHVVRLHFSARSATTADNFPVTYQPCVERRGQLKNVTDLRGEGNGLTGNTWLFSTIWLERDNMVCGGGELNCTRMDGMYLAAWSLQEVNFDGWDTSNWTVNTLYRTFHQCHNLRSVDLSHWDTSNWAVTTLGGMFGYCETLTELDLSCFDTHNWAVTSMDSVFRDCVSLQRINVSTWDTSGWAVTTLNNLFLSCCSLRSIDLSGWNTANWAVTSLSGLFQNNRALEAVKCNWNTSNWRVTNANYIVNNCYSLRELDLSSWDTSGWAVTSMTSIFNGCNSLEHLNVPFNTSNWVIPKLNGIFSGDYALKRIDGIADWDTSNWTVTDLSSMFYMCLSLEHLDLHKWNTSNWAVTTCGSMFNGCSSLKDVDIGVWDTSNWPVTSLYSMFSDCRAIEEIDLSDWDTTKFAVTDSRNFVAYAQHLKRLILPEEFHLANVANAVLGMDEYHSLEYFSGIDNCRGIVYFRYSYRLSHDSLISILNRLKTVSSTQTLSLGQTNRLKLTAAEIAIATEKGWTVA